GDPGIAIADLEIQDRADVVDDRLELARDQADLPQPQGIDHFGSMPYQSTREYRYTLTSLQEKFNGPLRPFIADVGCAARRARLGGGGRERAGGRRIQFRQPRDAHL